MIDQSPTSKNEFSQYILTKVTVYHDRKLTLAASTNSKMTFSNVIWKAWMAECILPCQGYWKHILWRKPGPISKCYAMTFTLMKRKLNTRGLTTLQILSRNRLRNSESLTHILTQCWLYKDIRERIVSQMEIICSKTDVGFKDIISNNSQLTQFILDCTSLNLPKRINHSEEICEVLFKLSRDLFYGIKKKIN